MTLTKQDACMDSYWSKYGHNIGFLKASVLGGGFSTEHTSTEYTYEWSRANGTIDNESFIADHPDSLRYLSSDTYYLTTTDINAPLCQAHDTILVDEYSFNYLATKWGNCVDTDDGWIELVIRQFEFNRDGSPYSIMCWDSNHRLIADDTIPALNPPDESGVPKGYDTLFNLANGLYYITITDSLGCYQDKQIKVNDPINPKMTLRAKGFKKVYDGIPVSLNSINVVEYDDNWRVPERAEYYVTSDQWRQLALRIGDSLIVSLLKPDTMIKDVDSVRNIIDGWSIKDAETGKDKTCLYHFYPIDSCIVIAPATLTITTGSATKEYDGTPLTSADEEDSGLVEGETITISTTGSQTDVGSSSNTYNLVWGTAKESNYTVVENLGTLTVTPNTQPITLTAKSASKKYDGIALINDTVVATGLPNGFYVEATTSGSQTDAGTSENVVSSYVIKNANGEDKTGNFANVTTVAGTLTVEPTDLFITTPSATKPYDGSALTAAFDPSTGAGSISGLVSGESITVTATGSQTEVGESFNTYTIDWGTTDSNNYDIHDNLGTLTVTSATITVTADNKSKTYGDSDPELTATVTGAAEGVVIAYTLSREAGENTGTYTITVTLGSNPNYEVTAAPGTFTITRATATVTADDKEKIADQPDPELTATVTGLQNGDTASVISYTLTRNSGEAIGSYTITPDGNAVQGNYNVTYVPGTLTITPHNEVVVRIIGHNNSTVYDKTEHGVSGYDVISISNPDYSEADFIFNGTAEAKRTNTDTTYMGLAAGQFINNNGTFDVTFIVTDGYQAITPAPATVKANTLTKTYGDVDPELIATVTGTMVGDTIAYALTRTAGDTVGSYPITVTLGSNPNYAIETTNAIFTINKKAATITANDANKTYGDADPTLTAIVEGLVASDVINYTLSRTPGDTVGTYDIMVNLGSNPNYAIETTNANFTINKKAATITANDTNKTYGDADPTLTATVEGSVEGDAIAYTLTRAAGDTAGTYPITVTLGINPNYQITTTNANFTINKKAATVAADSLGKTYGDADPELTATVTGSVAGDAIAYTLSRAAGDTVGTYAISVTLDNNPNYEVTTTDAVFTITKRAATVVADTLDKTYGDADPALTATITGIVEGDTIAYTLSREPGDTVSTYLITVELGDNPNYEVTAINGIFKIYKKYVMVAVDNKDKVYGDEDPELTVSLMDSIGEDVLNYTLNRAIGEDVGTYLITVTLGDNPNYEVMTRDGFLSITPAALTVMADDKAKVYGSADPALTTTISGLRNGDAANAINYSLSRVEGETVGTYTIKVTLGNNPNYTVTPTNGVFTITKKPATVLAINKNKTYGNADPVFTATVTGIVGNDVLNYTLARDTGENVGTYAITVTLEDNPNYLVTGTNGTFTITPASAIVMADDMEKVYGSDDPELTTTIGGLRNGDDASLISYTLNRESGEDVGEYAITPTGNTIQGNYQVTFLPGVLTITPVTDEVVVTIVGHHSTVEYDSTEHIVTGYDVTAVKIGGVASTLYTEADFSFSGNDTASRTEIGTTTMELSADNFTNVSANFDSVRFVVTPGYLKIIPACVKIVLNSENDYTWIEDFEDVSISTNPWTFDSPACWTVAEQYTGTPDTLPQAYYKPEFNSTEDGSYSLRMRFRYLLAMPELDESVDFSRLRLSLYVRQPYLPYKLQIGVMTDLENDSTFVPVATVNNKDKTVTYFECGFSSVKNITGEGRYIAFKNVGGSPNDPYCSNYLDDITLTYVDEECVLSDENLPIIETFEGYTNLSGATGIEPECWEVITEDVPLESTTKPQLYRGFNTSDDGDYSLRMRNRCVYAMPALPQTIHINDLMMTLNVRQPNSLYRLQVGVVDENGVFTSVKTIKCSSTSMQTFSMNFSSYNGQGNRIAFRNTLVPGTGRSTDYLDYSYNYIDDIILDYIHAKSEEVSNTDALDVVDYIDNIVVYPNPTTGILHIDAVKVQKVECYNQIGQLVAVYDNKRDISINNLADGVYTLRITVPQGVTMRKVVKR